MITIQPCRVVDPNTLARRISFITRDTGPLMVSTTPGVANFDTAIIVSKRTYSPKYKRK
jgi:hypothetical protein